MSESTPKTSKKICFAVLVHHKRDVIQDMLDNIRVHCPNSSIVLYNGGDDPHLCDNLGYPVCPTSRKLTYGLTAVYLIEVMEWLEQLEFPYEYLINLDSDTLFVREGYEAFIESAMQDTNYMGVDVFIRHKNWICGLHMKKEWGLWKDLLLSDEFLGVFNVGQVMSRQFVKRLLSWKHYGRLKKNLRIAKAWGLDEIVFVMLAKRFALNPKSYPSETGKAVRFRPYYKYREIIELMNHHPQSYLVHPVKRKMNDEVRILIRDLTRMAWRKYYVVSANAVDAHGKPGLLRSGNKLEVVAPLRHGGFGYWKHKQHIRNMNWNHPDAFGKGRWVSFSLLRSQYGNLEMIGRKDDRLIHLWRDGKAKTWNKTVCIGNGARGSPYLTENAKGNFQVIAPLKEGGIGYWWRNNNVSRKPWFGPFIFGKRKMDTVSLINLDKKRVVAVVAREGRFLSYIRENGNWTKDVHH